MTTKEITTKELTTKEKIIEEALNLFSTKGYEGVSMRDIGGAVGIRESSIYKHYAGKHAILDAIVVRVKEEINQMHTELKVPECGEDAVKDYIMMEFNQIAAMCTSVMLKQIKNPMVAKFRQLLTIEQYGNQELYQLYVELFMDQPLSYQEKVFEALMKKGIFKEEDPKIMAVEFFSPFFMLQYKLKDEQDQLVAMLQKHAVSFIAEHCTEEI